MSYNFPNDKRFIQLIKYAGRMRKFAERLKELRAERGLAIATLSKATGINGASICYWENGKYDIKSDQLIILASYFNCSTDFLLGLTDE